MCWLVSQQYQFRPTTSKHHQLKPQHTNQQVLSHRAGVMLVQKQLLTSHELTLQAYGEPTEVEFAEYLPAK
jgi:hypothetical protein